MHGLYTSSQEAGKKKPRGTGLSWFPGAGPDRIGLPGPPRTTPRLRHGHANQASASRRLAQAAPRTVAPIRRRGRARSPPALCSARPLSFLSCIITASARDQASAHLLASRGTASSNPSLTFILPLRLTTRVGIRAHERRSGRAARQIGCSISPGSFPSLPQRSRAARSRTPTRP